MEDGNGAEIYILRLATILDRFHPIFFCFPDRISPELGFKNLVLLTPSTLFFSFAGSSHSSCDCHNKQCTHQPFADPNSTKKKYTQTDYQAHVVSTARSLVGSTLFGVAMTVGLHYYKGMAMGLAIQTIMGPLNLFENPLVKALVFGQGFRREDKIFEEKTVEELTDDDDVVDASGNEVPKHALLGGTSTTKTLQGDTKSNKKKKQKKKDGTASDAVAFDTILLDTWDLGNQADIPHFITKITKDNCNHRTADSGWTPLMILAGLDAPGTVDGIHAVLALGGNAAITDGEGWHALHWSAFHGSVTAAQALMAHAPSLLTVRDTDGKSALDMATTEGNTEVAKYLAECTNTGAAAATASASTNDEPSEKGLRKRK